MTPILTWWVKMVKYTHRLSHLSAAAPPALYAVGTPTHPIKTGYAKVRRVWGKVTGQIASVYLIHLIYCVIS